MGIVLVNFPTFAIPDDASIEHYWFKTNKKKRTFWQERKK